MSLSFGFNYRLLQSVICLTLLNSCAYLEDRFGERCKSRAHIDHDIRNYLTTRFDINAPVRLGIIPFSVPANLTTVNNELPGVESTLAWKMQMELLRSELFPIVEVLKRDDWPGKKDDFFSGNHGAIRMARDAGFDLVLVGYLEAIRSMDEITAHTKIMDAESGITVWYGTSTVTSRRNTFRGAGVWTGVQERRPDMLFFSDILERVPPCIVEGLAKEE